LSDGWFTTVTTWKPRDA